MLMAYSVNQYIEVQEHTKKSKKPSFWPLFRLGFGVLWGVITRLLQPARMPTIAAPNKVFQRANPLISKYIKNLQKRKPLSINCLESALFCYETENTQISSFFKAQKNTSSVEKLLKTIPTLSREARYVAIPVAIESYLHMRHWVLFIYDRETNTLEFYDSTGLTLSDYSRARVWGLQKGSKLMLRELTSYIIEFYSPYKKPILLENNRLHQTDATNCALFVLHRIKSRCLEEKSFQSAQKDRLTSLKAFSDYREELYQIASEKLFFA